MVHLIVVTHGEFGAYLVEAAEGIMGKQTQGVKTVAISSRLRMEEVRARLLQAIEEMGSSDGVVIATDMPAGTPTNAVLPLVKDLPKVAVVSGLNLYMLVSAFGHRCDMDCEALAARMLADAQRSIQDVKAVLNAQPGARKPAGGGSR